MRDLRPATWYMMKVTAYNDAGLTEAELKFATLTFTGSKRLLLLKNLLIA